MSNNETKSVAQRFSAAADTYEVLATVQDRVAEELLRLIPHNSMPDSILELGCGTGLLTRRLLKQFPQAHIDAVDVSARMIQHAQTACGYNPRVSWYVSDVLRFEPKHTYPLVVSNSALHWVENLPAVIARIKAALNPGGHFIFSIMLHGTLRELRESRKKAAPHKPPLRELPEQETVIENIQHGGLVVVHAEVQEYKISYRSASAFLQAIHDQGVTGGTLSRSKAPLTRADIENLIMEYEWQYHDDAGMVYATYKTLFVHARQGS